MSFIKKANIGLVLTIVVIFLVVIYSVHTENTRNSQKQDIIKSCEEFIDITDKYYILPKDYQVIGENSQDVDLSNFYDDMEKELKTKTSNDSTANIQKIILTEYIKNQLIDTNKIIVGFKRDITKISSYSFDGKQVTITFNSKVTTKQKYKDVNIETGEVSEKIRENSFDIKGETITLENKNGDWKVVYANLQYNNQNTANNYIM